MRLSIDHRTNYRFTEGQARIVQLLRLTPSDTHDQTVASWRIDVDCDAHLKQGRDGFGNRITMLYAEGPIHEIEIAVRGEVLTAEANGILRGETETLPPELFLRPTALTQGSQAITERARRAIEGARDPLDQMHHWNSAVHARAKVDLGRPEPGLTAEAAFERPKGTPRDLAQIFIAGAHALGVPARYVSGYCQTAFGGATRPTPHGWAEAHIAGFGWVAFDPCFGLSADEHYVRVAVGLDSAGAAPVLGQRIGGGHEELAVDLQVGALSDD